MQGGNQLPRSDQKRFDEVRRISEAMASGDSVLVNKEKAENDEYTKIMVVDGEVLVGTDRRASKGPASSREKMIEGYVTKLGKEAALHKLSLDLEEESRPGKEAQLGEMEAEVGRLREALNEGNMAGIV
jgi:hypothetical protein